MSKHDSNFSVLNFLAIILTSLFVSSCGGGGGVDEVLQIQKKESGTIDASGNYAGPVEIDMLDGSPKISLQSNGRTNIVLQFIPRDNQGFPLSPDQIDVQLLRDGNDIDVESHLQSTANELQFDVNFGLVLDTSYSMIVNDALQPMLEAAQQSVQRGVDIWEPKAGNFTFYTSWFNDFIFSSIDTINKQWEPVDIADIPAPEQGAATKLFAATDYMIDKLSAIPSGDKPVDAPADQNILLVFSDGEDNISWKDTSDLDVENLFTANGAEYLRTGYKTTSIDDLLLKLEETENISVHVIGLGDNINEKNLQDIAKKGNGTFRKNPDTEDLGSVFDRVVQEFTTLQTHGANMPLPPGDYNFALRVVNKSGNQFADYNFKFRTGAEGAEIIPE